MFCFADDLISDLDLDGESSGVRDLFVHDGIAYLANRSDGLAIVDVSDPEQPVLLSTIQSFEYALDVAVHDGLAFVGTLGEGMFIIDVSDPQTPVLVGHYNELYDVYATVLKGDIAYLACHSNGIRVLDISDPSSPIEIQHVATEVFIIGLALENELLVAPFYGENIRLFDVSDPEHLVLLDTVGSPNSYFDVAIEGELVAVLNRSSRSGEVYDLSASTLEPYANVYVGFAGSLYDIEIHSGRVYIADDRSGVTVFDVTEPRDDVDIYGYLYGHEVYGLSAEGGTLYVGGDEPSLSLVDVSGLESPVVQTITGFDNDPRFVVATGFLYAYDHSKVQVNRVGSDGVLDTLLELEVRFDRGTIASVAAGQDLMYIGNDSRFDIAVYDIGDPENPVFINISRVGNSLPLHMAAFGPYLIAGSEADLAVLDYSDPLQPVQISGISLTAYVDQVLVEDDLLYIDLQDFGFMIYDISDVNQPLLVSDMSGSGSRYTSIAVRDGVLYAATRLEGIDIYDCTDPASVALAGHVQLQVGFPKIDLSDEVLYVAADAVKHTVFRLNDPFTPELIVSGGRGESVNHVALIGEHAYHSGFSFNFGGLVDVIRVVGCQCPADLNGDGSLNFFDVSTFLVGYLGQDVSGDWNNDGVWDFFDVSAFLGDYTLGCP